MEKTIECSIYRGGTSRGVFLDERVLTDSGENRDSILMKLIGGPDPKQIDGLGAQVVTSKVALIKKSERSDADVDYTFAQIVLGKNQVDYSSNCGNISSAVGPYAIEKGFVKPCDGITNVRIFNTNTKKIIVSRVETPNGEVTYEGNYNISGVNGTGSKIMLEFIEPGGAVTGKILPTGNVTDFIEVDGYESVEVSIIDVSNLFIYVRAQDVGMKGNESISDIDNNENITERLENIRGVVAQELGYVKDSKEAFEISPAIPKIVVVGPPADYKTSSGDFITKDNMDVQIRMMSMKKTHKTFAMTGGMCTAAASAIKGTIVNRIFDVGGKDVLRIAHPGGLMEVGVKVSDDRDSGSNIIDSTTGFRTARRIMTGIASYIE